VPNYVSHSLFQELPPAALAAVNNYLAKHSDFDAPENLSRLVGLVARVKDSLNGSAKKGKFSQNFYLF
jgi:hypothetical protein